MRRFLCICLSSTIQKTVIFKKLQLEQVNRSDHYRLDASGKAVNSARVLNQLERGCCTTLCPLGEKNQQLFLSLAERDGLDIGFVTVPGFTRECLTLLDSAAHSTTELVISEPAEITDADKYEIRLLRLINEKIKGCDAVLLAGSRSAIWSDELYPTIAAFAHENKKIFLADFIGDDLKNTLSSCIPQIIKINDDEFCATFGLTTTDELELESAITQKSRELQNCIVVTRGTKPTFAAQNGEFRACPAEKITPVNTTACGDSFNAGFLYEFTRSGNFELALQKGTWCAARNAEHECPGTIETGL